MRVKKSVEQAICLLLLIGHNKKEKYRSFDLSEKLKVSDSYLKKIIRQLAIANIVSSEAGKNGGVTLKRDPSKISILDIFEAIEGKEPFASTYKVVDNVFIDYSKKLKEEKTKMILNVFDEAEKEFKDKLKTITLDMVMVKDKA